MKSIIDISSEARAHDLRHQLTLMAVELSLARDRLLRREVRPRGSLHGLLDRLDEGFARCRAILGHGSARAAQPGGDRGALARELWNRLEAAGRLPRGASMSLSEPWHFPGSDEALYSLLLNLLENACAASGGERLFLQLASGGILVENGGAALPEVLARGLESGDLPTPSRGRGHGLREIHRRAGQLGLAIRVETGPPVRIHLTRPLQDTLLVVEDDENLRSLLAELCRREGFQVEEAECFPGEIPDACVGILADLGLPGESGLTGLARAKSERPALRTLLLTGNREATLGHQAGVDRVILKPGLAILRDELRVLKEGLS